MKFLFKLFFGIVAIALFVALIAYAAFRITISLAIDESPKIDAFEKASLDDLQRIKALAIEFQRNLSGSEVKTVKLSERDINLGISHFGPTQVRFPKSVFVATSLNGKTGVIYLTLPAQYAIEQVEAELQNTMTPNAQTFVDHLKGYATDKWINLSLPITLRNELAKSEWIDTGKISIGAITLTEALSDKIVAKVITEVKESKQSINAMTAWNNIENLSIDDSELTIQFRLPNDQNHLLNSYQSVVLTAGEIERVDSYVDVLRNIPKQGSLVLALQPLFEEAKNRATVSSDPIAENKAALLALSKLYGGDQLLALIDANPAQLLVLAPKPYSIYRRLDLAQHYVLSAGLTLIADESLAELIGIDKEMSDLMSGRKMSAWDLMADRAGVRLAENATRSAKRARELQIALSRVKSDQDILPDLAKDFAFSEDSFRPEETAELTTLIDLYLDKHPLLRR